MRRLGAIATIAIVVLALAAGPAFASACPGVACGAPAGCSVSVSPPCPMQAGAATARTTCGHVMDRIGRDAVPTRSGPVTDLATVAVAGPATRPAVAPGAVRSPLADARGAPHLTSVIRI
jgi:hypothetical protein